MSKRIDEIQSTIDRVIEIGYQPVCIIISNQINREIFINGELPKSKSLEEHFGLSVMLDDRQGEILIGVK